MSAIEAFQHKVYGKTDRQSICRVASQILLDYTHAARVAVYATGRGGLLAQICEERIEGVAPGTPILSSNTPSARALHSTGKPSDSSSRLGRPLRIINLYNAEERERLVPGGA